MRRRSDTITAEQLVYVEALVATRMRWPFNHGPFFRYAVRYVARLRRGFKVVGTEAQSKPKPPRNPTECDQVWYDGAWRIWCESDLAGPCRGCPYAEKT